MARTKKVPDLLTFTCDANLCNLNLSEAQEVLIRTLDGLPLKNKAQEDLFRACTGLPRYVRRRRCDTTAICGVRSGKDSRLIASLVIYEAVTGDHHRYLTPGEIAWHVVVAQGFRGAVDVSFGYVAGLFDASPMLSSLVVERKQYEIHLSNRAVLTAFPCTRTAPLGYTIRAAGLSEVAYFRSDAGVNVDREIIAGVRRGMATVPGARIIKASSPYTRTGELFRAFQTCYGVEDAPTFVWRSESALMNPSLDTAFLAEEERRHPELYRRNYLAEFIDAVSGFLSEEAITGAVATGRRELPPLAGILYAAFIDSAGGTSGGDRFAVAIGHREPDGRILLDCVRAWSPPFNPMNVVAEAAELLRRYDCHTVKGDRFSGGFVRDGFRQHHIEYIPSEMDKSGLYHELLPRLNAGLVELLDMPELLRELRSLERRRGGPGGKDRVDHAPGQRDDLANCVAGIVANLAAHAINPDLHPESHGQRDCFLLQEGRGWEALPHPTGVGAAPSIDRVKGYPSDSIDWGNIRW